MREVRQRLIVQLRLRGGALAGVEAELGDQLRALLQGLGEQAIELGLFVCGSAGNVRKAFEGYWNDLRFGNLLVLCQFGTLPADLTRRSMELFAREVMPALKAMN